MFKFNRDQFKGFILGVVTVILFASLLGTAVAAGKLTSIKVYKDNIKLYVDGKLVIPTNSSGKKVDTFIYGGTPYLPVSAISGALTNNEKTVKWDSKKSSVYVGKAPVAAQTDIATIKPYDYHGSINVGSEASFTILDKKFTPFNRLESGFLSGYGKNQRYYNYANYTYMLHSNYSSLNGYFVLPYETLGSEQSTNIKFYNVTKKGEQTLIEEYNTTAGDDIQQINVDLRGVDTLKIEFDDYSAFYNVTLAGVK